MIAMRVTSIDVFLPDNSTGDGPGGSDRHGRPARFTDRLRRRHASVVK
jgi:hypothetical protein